MVKYIGVVAACTCAIFLCVQGASILEPPSNKTALVGQNVTLMCRTEIPTGDRDSLTWFEMVSSPTGVPTVIYKSIEPDKIHRPEKFEVFDTYNLRIINAQTADGGLYSCGLYVENVQHAAHVTILGKPELKVPEFVKEGDAVSVQCSAEFGAKNFNQLDSALLPTIHIHIEPTDLIPCNFSYEIRTTDSGSKVNVIHAETNSVAFYGQHDEKKVFCTVKSNVSTTDETTIRVYYRTRTVTVDTSKKVFLVGDEIVCKADGYPAPTLKWTNVNEGTSVFNNEKLPVRVEMVGKKNKWNCSASNAIEGTSYEASKVIDFAAAAGQTSLHQIDVTVFSIAFVCFYMFVRLFQS